MKHLFLIMTLVCIIIMFMIIINLKQKKEMFKNWETKLCSEVIGDNMIHKGNRIKGFKCDWPHWTENEDASDNEVAINLNLGKNAWNIFEKLDAAKEAGRDVELTDAEKEDLGEYYAAARGPNSSFRETCCKKTRKGFAPNPDSDNEIEKLGRVDDRCLEDTYHHVGDDKKKEIRTNVLGNLTPDRYFAEYVSGGQQLRSKEVWNKMGIQGFGDTDEYICLGGKGGKCAPIISYKCRPNLADMSVLKSGEDSCAYGLVILGPFLRSEKEGRDVYLKRTPWEKFKEALRKKDGPELPKNGIGDENTKVYFASNIKSLRNLWQTKEIELNNKKNNLYYMAAFTNDPKKFKIKKISDSYRGIVRTKYKAERKKLWGGWGKTFYTIWDDHHHPPWTPKNNLNAKLYFDPLRPEVNDEREWNTAIFWKTNSPSIKNHVENYNKDRHPSIINGALLNMFVEVGIINKLDDQNTKNNQAEAWLLDQMRNKFLEKSDCFKKTPEGSYEALEDPRQGTEIKREWTVEDMKDNKSKGAAVPLDQGIASCLIDGENINLCEQEQYYNEDEATGDREMVGAPVRNLEYDKNCKAHLEKLGLKPYGIGLKCSRALQIGECLEKYPDKYGGTSVDGGAYDQLVDQCAPSKNKDDSRYMPNIEDTFSGIGFGDTHQCNRFIRRLRGLKKKHRKTGAKPQSDYVYERACSGEVQAPYHEIIAQRDQESWDQGVEMTNDLLDAGQKAVEIYATAKGAGAGAKSGGK